MRVSDRARSLAPCLRTPTKPLMVPARKMSNQPPCVMTGTCTFANFSSSLTAFQ